MELKFYYGIKADKAMNQAQSCFESSSIFFLCVHPKLNAALNVIVLINGCDYK